MNIHSVVRSGVGFVLFLVLFGCGTDCPSSKKVENLSSARIKEISNKINGLSVEDRKSYLKKVRVAERFVPSQLIIKFANDAAESKIKSTLETLGSSVLYEFKTNRALLVTVPSALTDADLLGAAAALSEVEAVDFVHPNSILKAVDAPNDPLYSKQSPLNNDGVNGKRADSDIDAPEAWQKTTGSSSVVVGIIDTGIDYNHPDLKENIWINPGESGLDSAGKDKSRNGLDDDGNGYIDDVRGWDFVNNDNDPMDDNQHGTHVAGTVGAVGNNGIGIAGVSWNVRLAALKFLSAGGSGYLSDAVKAVEYATMMEIPITNNSWGGGGYEAALEAAIKAAADKGYLFVAAAGNSASNNDKVPAYPASYNLPNIISVAAVDSEDNLASFTNVGASTVHIAAPGVDVLSTLPNEGYGSLSGTSMAAPHVAGVAALIKGLQPDFDFVKIKARLLGGAERLPSLANKVVSGRLNAFSVLEEDTVPPNPVREAVISFVGITRLELRATPSGDDGTAGAASSYEIRSHSEPIDSEAKWEKAKRLSYEIISQSPGLGMRVVDLPLKSQGFLMIRATDNAGNVSDFGTPIPFALANPEEAFATDGETLDGLTLVPEQSWGQEDVKDRGRVLSDSPSGAYLNNQDSSLVLPSVKVSALDILLTFTNKLSCEAGYDWAYIEYKKNDEPFWNELASYSAEGCEWANMQFQLGDKVKINDTLTFRFRLKTDYMVVKEGWLLDDIKILMAPAETLPEPPTALWAIPSGQQALLQWAAPVKTGSSPIRDYVIHYSNDEGNSWTIVDDGVSTKTDIIVPNLTIGSTYLFRVAAVNSKGAGPFSNYSGPVTPFSTPEAPTITAVLAGPNSAHLIWKLPPEGRGPVIVRGYVIRYSVDEGANWSDPISSPFNLSYFTVTNLNPNESYVFQVAAFNEAGTGAFSASSAPVEPFTIPDAPTHLRTTSGNTQVLISWSSPKNGGSLIQDYIIQYSGDSGSSWVDYIDGVSSETSAVVTGLTNGTSYLFRVAAANIAGVGPFSESTAEVIPATVPDSPEQLIGQPGSREVRLTWIAPKQNGGRPITHYLIEYSTGTGWSKPISTTLAVTTFTVTGLTNGTNYIFRVAAVNGIGSGMVSSDSATLTPLLVEAPQNTTALLSDNRVELNFEPVAGAVKYKVMRAVDSSSAAYSLWAWVEQPAASNSKVSVSWDRGLFEIGKTYYFKVVAIDKTAAEMSQESLPAEVLVTLHAAPKNVTAEFTSNRVELNFEPVAGAVKYKVMRAVDSSSAAYSLWAWVGRRPFSGAKVSASWDRGLFEIGKTYYFKVVAVDKNTAEMSQESLPAGVLVVLPGAPKNVTAEFTSNRVELNFEPVAGAVSYKVLRAVNSLNARYSLWAWVGQPSAPGAKVSASWDRGLFEAGKTYYFKVVAVDKVAIEMSQESAPSGVLVPSP